MERLAILAPALVLLGLLFISFTVYCFLCLTGRVPSVVGLNRRKYSDLIGPFTTRYALWLLAPFERAMVKLKISPNVLTFTSLLICASAGVAFATGWLASAAWLYAGAGLMDILDGRLARATNQQSKAGAFLDSVTDRWGELFVFAGLGWLFRSTPWLPVVFLAVGASLLVSYTRARGESLGVDLDGGTMQRAERISVISIGSMCAALFAVARGEAFGVYVLGIAVGIVAFGSSVTALQRGIHGYQMLRANEFGPPTKLLDSKLLDSKLLDSKPHGTHGTHGAHESATNLKVAIESEHRPAA